MGGSHYVRRVEELDNRLNGQIGARRRRSEKSTMALAAASFFR
jgi:hypothetical protein